MGHCVGKTLLSLVLLGAAQLSGCAASDGDRRSTVWMPLFSDATAASVPKEPRAVAGSVQRAPDLASTDGACGQGAECVERLKRLVSGPDRSWIGRSESPASFADGTRLFAYRALRNRLTCREIVSALADVKASAALLRSTPAVASQRAQKATALAAEVSGELAHERDNRCGPNGLGPSASGKSQARSH